jgi:hypothetical protein
MNRTDRRMLLVIELAIKRACARTYEIEQLRDLYAGTQSDPALIRAYRATRDEIAREEGE